MATNVARLFLMLCILEVAMAYVIRGNIQPFFSSKGIKRPNCRMEHTSSPAKPIHMNSISDRTSRRSALFVLIAATTVSNKNVFASENSSENLEGKPLEKLRKLNNEKLKELVAKDIVEGQFLVTGQLTRLTAISGTVVHEGLLRMS